MDINDLQKITNSDRWVFDNSEKKQDFIAVSHSLAETMEKTTVAADAPFDILIEAFSDAKNNYNQRVDTFHAKARWWHLFYYFSRKGQMNQAQAKVNKQFDRFLFTLKEKQTATLHAMLEEKRMALIQARQEELVEKKTALLHANQEALMGKQAEETTLQQSLEPKKWAKSLILHPIDSALKIKQLKESLKQLQGEIAALSQTIKENRFNDAEIAAQKAPVAGAKAAALEQEITSLEEKIGIPPHQNAASDLSDTLDTAIEISDIATKMPPVAGQEIANYLQGMMNSVSDLYQEGTFDPQTGEFTFKLKEQRFFVVDRDHDARFGFEREISGKVTQNNVVFSKGFVGFVNYRVVNAPYSTKHVTFEKGKYLSVIDDSKFPWVARGHSKKEFQSLSEMLLNREDQVDSLRAK